jgi:GT2 family glycosyltransferase
LSKYSVIIPTSNNFNHLAESLSYVKNGSKGEDVEIIVIDNGSTDNTAEFLADETDVITITNERNEGFGKAMNKGIAKATGEWLLLLNDDALVPDGYLKKFEASCKEYERVTGTKRASIAVPKSNYVGMRAQQQECPTRGHFEMVAKQVYTQNYRKVQQVGIVSGLCMFVNKEIFETIGDFDERFFAGCEDVDISVRAYEAGFITIISNDVFVYHYGSRTIDRLPELKRGTAHIKDLLDKYSVRSKQKQKLGSIYRVKLRDAYDAEVFARSIKKASEFSDHLFILDDNGPWKVHVEENRVSTIKPGGGHCNIVELDCKISLEHYDRSFDERRDRNDIIRMAKDAGMDWVFSLDADEVVEDKVDRTYMEKLINTPDPMCQGYAVHYYTFWNDEEHFNSGDVWKNMAGNRLVRLTGDPKIFLGAKSTFHVGNIPFVPSDMSRVTSIRIKHYGYVHPAQRQRKYEWYERMDTDKNPVLIGHKDYRHLIDENPIVLRKWEENASVGLATIMKNEEGSLYDFLRSYAPFFDEMTLVDTGSTDNSITLAKMFGANVIEADPKEVFLDIDGDSILNYGKARNMALDGCTTDWIVHMDIDEHMQDIITTRRLLDTNLDGYLYYVNNLMEDNRYSLSETIRLFRRDANFRYDGYVHETLQRNKEHRIGRSPVKITHFGYLKPKDQIRKKMQSYFKLNKKQIEDNPKDPRPYYAIAIHYLEEGFIDLAEENLVQATELDSNFYQCNKDLAYLYMNKARVYFDKVTKTIPQDHPFHQLCASNCQQIDEMVGHQSRVSPGHLDGIS